MNIRYSEPRGRWIRRVLLSLMVLGTFSTGAGAQDSSEAEARTAYGGIEIAELAQNRFRDLGPENYTIFLGQRFSGDRWGKWGWRVLSMNVDLAEEHLADPNTVCCIEGNREGLRGTLAVHRLYLDYHIADLEWRFLRFTPVVGVGVGYNHESLVNTRQGEEWSFGAFALAAFPRLQFVFFDRVFMEFPALDLSVHRRRAQPVIGDVRVTKTEYMSQFGWATIGVQFPL